MNKIKPDFSTVEGLNGYLFKEYGIRPDGPRMDVRYRSDRSSPEMLADKFLEGSVPFIKHGKNKDDFNLYKRNIDFLNTQYDMVENTGGGRNDCLIISFLMGTVPNYMKLSETNRNAFASHFRRVILPDLIGTSVNPNIRELRPDRQEALMRELRGADMLTDIHIQILGHLFQRTILSLETAKTARVNVAGGKRKVMGEAPAARLIPSTHTKFTEPYEMGIIICNRGNGHYETVINRPFGKMGTTYQFSFDILQQLHNDINTDYPFDNRTDTDEHKRALADISFNAGDSIMYNGKRYIILERKIAFSGSEGKLVGLWITPHIDDFSPGYQDFLKNSYGTSFFKYKEPTNIPKDKWHIIKEKDGTRLKPIIFIGAEGIRKAVEANAYQNRKEVAESVRAGDRPIIAKAPGAAAPARPAAALALPPIVARPAAPAPPPKNNSEVIEVSEGDETRWLVKNDRGEFWYNGIEQVYMKGRSGISRFKGSLEAAELLAMTITEDYQKGTEWDSEDWKYAIECATEILSKRKKGGSRTVRKRRQSKRSRKLTAKYLN